MSDETHDPNRRSWVESANDPASDFPIQNLPFGVFRRREGGDAARVGVAIGDQIVDVSACASAGFLASEASLAAERCSQPRLNDLMMLGRSAATTLRRALSVFLDAGVQHDADRSRVLVSMRDAEMLLPARIGDYTDFYASIEHATNVGSMFRPDNPLLPNYKWVPIGYHGRASSIVVSGTNIRRPLGQTRDGTNGAPTFGPSRRLDYELEVGAFIGVGNALGTPIAIDDVDDHLFGVCLLNDWSARDIQTWEYQPLGPFLAKNFASTISPWVVTIDALDPFRAPARSRAADDPQPLPYLASSRNATAGAFEITLEVSLLSSAMRTAGMTPFVVSVSEFANMYWTIGQMVTHHASNGCNFVPGDLLGSGTVSGASKDSRGCLLERTWRGTEPLQLPTGETRSFLEDGDEVIIRGFCDRDGVRRIGLGECRGLVLPAIAR